MTGLSIGLVMPACSSFQVNCLPVIYLSSVQTWMAPLSQWLLFKMAHRVGSLWYSSRYDEGECIKWRRNLESNPGIGQLFQSWMLYLLSFCLMGENSSLVYRISDDRESCDYNGLGSSYFTYQDPMLVYHLAAWSPRSGECNIHQYYRSWDLHIVLLKYMLYLVQTRYKINLTEQAWCSVRDVYRKNSLEGYYPTDGKQAFVLRFS